MPQKITNEERIVKVNSLPNGTRNSLRVILLEIAKVRDSCERQEIAACHLDSFIELIKDSIQDV